MSRLQLEVQDFQTSDGAAASSSRSRRTKAQLAAPHRTRLDFRAFAIQQVVRGAGLGEGLLAAALLSQPSSFQVADPARFAPTLAGNVEPLRVALPEWSLTMTEVVITRDDRIETAIIEALERIPLASLVRGRVVAVKPNDTWASRDDTTGITQPDTLRAVLRAVRAYEPGTLVVTGGARAAGTHEGFRLRGLLQGFS